MVSTSAWTMPTQTTGKYTPVKGYANAAFLKLMIPELLPKHVSFPLSDKKKTCSLNTGIYINEAWCFPVVQSQIEAQSYLSIPVPLNVHFANDEFRQGDELIVEIENGSVDEMYVSGKSDPSHKAK